ncbi:hypothetical protein NC653_030066 [Populus alba x Populus x berolinensis]|uniref:Thioester reductase (TE) domain-containing protein n=1 Tax=Populus alba x Populus x berolinensis TaxID=444605 RepID=A0AAD6LVQ5_9ROSI|nr:hypothetical protein NC653_030066 [Populus alba x Populus x berolinensis]
MANSVRALVRRTATCPASFALYGGELELAYGDVTDYRSLLDAFFGCDESSMLPAVVNVGGLKMWVQAAKETKTIEKVHHEKYFYTEYERSKVAADNVASQAAAEGLPIVTLYPGVVYGPGNSQLATLWLKCLRSSTCFKSCLIVCFLMTRNI